MRLRVQLLRSNGDVVVELVSKWSGDIHKIENEINDENILDLYPELVRNVIECLREMCDGIEKGSAVPMVENKETGERIDLKSSNGFGLRWKAKLVD